MAGLVVAVGSQFALAVIPAAMLVKEGITDATAAQERVMEMATSFPFVAASVLLLGLGLGLVPLVTAKLSKTSLREGLGFRPAHPGVFFIAPIGILSLGPLSDYLVRFMKEFFPSASFGALEAIEALTTQHPYWLLFPFIALLPGFQEEIFFRGLVQRSMGNVGWKAIVVSGLTFGVFHMDPHHVAGVIPLGLYLAWLSARTGSLWVPITTHIANNATALAAAQWGMDAVDPEETLPWWAVPIGLAVCAVCVWGISVLTRDRERHTGPIVLSNATERILPPRRDLQLGGEVLP